MESYCVFLMGNFIALPAFANRYGVYSPKENIFVIETSWQSALQVGGPIGAIIGVTIAGPITSRIGYRWAFISSLMVLNAFIFIFYFAKSLPIMLLAQLLEGIPWGIFIANSPAYCSEIVPMPLRAPATQMLQMFWAIGAIIVQGVTYNYNGLDSETAYRVPIALQWMFPTPLAILIFLAPESPWWLTRKGKYDQAAKSVARLGNKALGPDHHRNAVAMMRRTIELEKDTSDPSLLELFKGRDLYRTAIVCGVYAAQNLTGNLIANQAVFFFRRESILLPPWSRSMLMYHRGRYWSESRVCSWFDHFRSADDIRYALLDPHHIPWKTTYLRLGLGYQHFPSRHARRRSYRTCLQRVSKDFSFPSAGFFGSHHFCALYPWTGARFLGYHRRDLLHSS